MPGEPTLRRTARMAREMLTESRDHPLRLVEVSAALFEDQIVRPLEAAALPPVAPDRADLDAAWAEAEAALPEAWWFSALVGPPGGVGSWTVYVRNGDERGPTSGEGDTPAAALRELARRLRAGEGGKG